MLTLDKIYHAKFVLKKVARKTDLIAAPRLCPGTDLYLKTENLQVTGSFKVRGAYYKISQLSEEERAKGVIACRPATMPRAWRWPPPAWALKVWSACPTVPRS